MTLLIFVIHKNFYFFNLYLNIIMLCLISILMLSISKTIATFFRQDKEKISEYECGFEPFDSATRQPFEIHFYMVGLLFLIFDVELALLFPWSLYMLIYDSFFCF